MTVEQTPVSDDDALPVPADDNAPARVDANGDSYGVAQSDPGPYGAFRVSREDLDPVHPLAALLADPDVGGYLKRGHGESAFSPGRLKRAGLGLLLALAVIVPFCAIPDWKMFSRYRPIAPADTPKPLAYTGDIPVLYRAGVREINADIAAGNRWSAVAAGLLDLAENGTSLPDPLREWADTEYLVTLASRDVPPTESDARNAARAYAELEQIAAAKPGAKTSFRAGAAYARFLHDMPPETGKTTTDGQAVMTLLDRIRGDHPELFDANAALLQIAAERHIAALPKEYAEKSRELQYHWRQAAHAIKRLYALHGEKNSARVRALDRRRWETAKYYLGLTLLTGSWERFGWPKSIILDDVEYTRDQVNAELDKLK